MFAKIFAKLFGETEELEIQNLEKKVILTAVGLACCLIGLLLLLVKLNSVGEIVYGIGGIALFVALFMWGFGAIKKLFGIGTIGAIFSGNVVFGVVIFLLCMMAAYLISIFVAFIGTGRYIYLKVKKSQERG